MSPIVRTIMKIVLIIIGLTAVSTADDGVAQPQHYVSEYSAPHPGREAYKKELEDEEWLPSYGQEKKENYDVYRIYPYQKIGLHGFGFETRLAFADGLRNPITPKTLSPYYDGYRSLRSYGDLRTRLLENHRIRVGEIL